MTEKPAPRTKRRRQQRIFEQVCERIRGQIADGVLNSGDKLPAEREIAEQLGFSRSAVREALRALEAAGILELKNGVNGGAFIRQADGQALTQSIHDAFLFGKMPMSDITEVRLTLLPRAAAIACARGSEADFSALEENIQACRAAGHDTEKLHALIPNFYKLLGAATKNDLLSMLINAATDVFARAFVTLPIRPDEELYLKREKLLQALRARSAAAAARAMAEHLIYSHQLIATGLEKGPKRLNAPATGKLDRRSVDDAAYAQALDVLERDAAARARVERQPPSRHGPLLTVASQAESLDIAKLHSENNRLKALLAEAMLEMSVLKEQIQRGNAP